MRIGVFLPNWVGDVVMATPALRALRQHVGDRGTLIGIMRPYVVDVLAGTNWLDELLVYQRRSFESIRRLIARLRGEQLDAVLLLTNSFSTGTFAWLSGARRRVGFAMHGRRLLLTDPLIPSRLHGQPIPYSAVDHYLAVVEAFGCRAVTKTVELATTPEEERAVEALWQQFAWDPRQPVIVLNTGGAYGAAKTWPSEHFSNLARQLVTDRDVRVLFLCGPSERDCVVRICQHANHPHIKSLAAQKLGLPLSKACVRRSHLMVTTDSGPRHFAAAFGVPVVTLFGPTDPRWSDNYHPSAIDLQLDVPCGPCGKRVCPLEHHRCMRDLTVNHVASAALSLLDSSMRHRAA
jgi:heptosyltransferase-2